MFSSDIHKLLRCYVNGEKCPTEYFVGYTQDDWFNLYNLATKQGISAITYDIISALPKSLAPTLNIKLKWALQSERISEKINSQTHIANELTSIFKKADIDTIVLKGIGLGIYYPSSSYRECGDFDCYLFDNYRRGIDIATNRGAFLQHQDYKHAQLYYKGLNVEVHQYFTSFRGEKSKHKFEHTLTDILRKESYRKINNESDILIANPTFNVCFLLYHTLFHFLFESVKLRHLLDWGFIIRAEKDNIDWEKVIDICKEHKMLKFAEAITAICNEYLGFNLDIPFKTNNEYRDKILQDVMLGTDGVSNKKGWSRRFQLLKNTYNSRWKYELIDSSFFVDIIKRAYYFTFSNDQLKTL